MEKLIQIYVNFCASKAGGGVGMVVVENDVLVAEGGWYDPGCTGSSQTKEVGAKAINLAVSLAKKLTKRDVKEITIYSDSHVVVKGFSGAAKVKAEYIAKKDSSFMGRADELARNARDEKVKTIVDNINTSRLKEMYTLPAGSEAVKTAPEPPVETAKTVAPAPDSAAEITKKAPAETTKAVLDPDARTVNEPENSHSSDADDLNTNAVPEADSEEVVDANIEEFDSDELSDEEYYENEFDDDLEDMFYESEESDSIVESIGGSVMEVICLDNVKDYLEGQMRTAIKSNNAKALEVCLGFLKALKLDGIDLTGVEVKCIWADVKSIELAFLLGQFKDLINLEIEYSEDLVE